MGIQKKIPLDHTDPLKRIQIFSQAKWGNDKIIVPTDLVTKPMDNRLKQDYKPVPWSEPNDVTIIRESLELNLKKVLYAFKID